MSDVKWKWTSKWGERGRMEAIDDGTVMHVEQCDEPQGWSWETILPADTVRTNPSLLRRGWAPTLEAAKGAAEDAAPTQMTLTSSDDGVDAILKAALADPVGFGAAIAAASARPFSPFVQPTASQLVGRQFIVEAGHDALGLPHLPYVTQVIVVRPKIGSQGVTVRRRQQFLAEFVQRESQNRQIVPAGHAGCIEHGQRDHARQADRYPGGTTATHAFPVGGCAVVQVGREQQVAVKQSLARAPGKSQDKSAAG